MNKIVMLIFLLWTYSFTMEQNQFLIEKNGYKVLEFSKTITKIRVSDSKTTEVSFVSSKSKPLQLIKVYAKAVGHSTLFIHFEDESSVQVKLNVVINLGTMITLAKQVSPELIVNQVNGKIILKGKVDTQKQKVKIIDIFTKAGIDTTKDLIDLMEVKKPNNMLRIKLYVVEINNDKGKDIQHQWATGYKNYLRSYSSSQEAPIPDERSFNPTLANAIEASVTLTGGLTSAANLLGGNFNTGVVLRYLQTEGVAKVLDETTLLTLENKEAKFHAGGTIYIRIQTTTSDGVPTTEVRPLNYGLQLQVKSKEIINDEFVDLEIVTKSTQIDWSNQVDGIPSFTDKTVETAVLIQDKSTIVLGGLISNSDAKNYQKIPLLSDIPLLGELFKSKNFQAGRSELVFFVIPEIVDVTINNQSNQLKEASEFIKKDIQF